MTQRSALITWFVLGVAGALIWSVVQSILTFPALEILPSMATRYVLLSWLRPFAANLTPAVGTAALLAFGLFVKGDSGPEVRLISISRPFLVGVIVVTALLAAWHAALGPLVEHRLDEFEFQSDLAVQSWEDARTAISTGDFREAEEKIDLYEYLTGDGDEAERLREELIVDRGQRERQRRLQQQETPEQTERANDVGEQSVPELIFRAAEFLENREFFSAHYFATLALDMSDVERQDARRIQQQAWQAIQSEGQKLEDEQAQELYEAKLQAYEAMQQGDAMPERLVEAYYRFQELTERVPADPDVQRYAKEVESRILDVAVFSDELQQYAATPGVQNILFDNKLETNETEIVAIDRLVQVRQGTYFYGVEVMNIQEETVTHHYRAPYGKLVGNTLVLRSIRRDGTGIDPDRNSTVPTYYIGSRREPEAAFLKLNVPIDQVSLLGAGGSWYRWAHVGRLIRAPRMQRSVGLPGLTAYSALTERLASLLSFPVVSLVLMTLAWRYRNRYEGRPPALALLLVPLFPFLVLFVDRLFRFVMQVLGVAALTALPQGLGLSATMLVTVLLLAMAIWYHAAQTTRS